MSKYTEIIELYDYCKKIGVHATLSELYDGYKIEFANGGDVIQHRLSYGAEDGCVEPAIRSRLDYTAVPLKNAKQLIRRHKERLNSERKDGAER